MSRMLRWKNVIRPGEACHVGWTTVGVRGRSSAPHRHDFAEVFWIESGQGVHRINGRSVPLRTGDLVCVRPADEHEFGAVEGDPLCQTNIAFPARLLNALRERHAEIFGRLWAASRRDPRVFHVPAERMAGLRREAERLAQHRTSRLGIERFLLNLAGELDEAPSGSAQGEPAWLKAAVQWLQEPEHLSAGVAGLVRQTGRSHEHVTRVVRSRHGCTPTELVQTARLQHAASRLLLSDDKVESVAREGGFRSLPHFYRLFRERFGQSPRQYRRQRALAWPG